MNRLAAIVVGALLLGLVGALVWKSSPSPSPGVAGGSSSASGSAVALVAMDAGIPADALLAKVAFAAPDSAAPELPELAGEGEPSAALPTGSPKTVRFGVILVQYRGAQAAPPTARSKDDAVKLARELAEGARSDFKAQVARGDVGSMDDAGRIPRGVLEAPVELALFTLPKGGVSDPIDTPRGFWIVRRVE